MLRGTGTTSSVIQVAGSPGPGLSARPNALVVLVNTKAPTPALTASSSSTKVPVTLVSTKACRSWDPTCGLCSVAAWRTPSTPVSAAPTTSRSPTDPRTVVNGESRTSRPTTSAPRARSTRTSASPRCPALPVTRILLPATRGPYGPEVTGRQPLLSQWMTTIGFGRRGLRICELWPLGAVTLAVVVLAAVGYIPTWSGLVHLVALPLLDVFTDLRVLLPAAEAWPVFVLVLLVVLGVRVVVLAYLLGGPTPVGRAAVRGM